MKLSDLDKHILLYAKNWYEIEDTITDLKKICGRFFAIDPHLVDTDGVYKTVLDLFFEIVPQEKQKLFWEDIFKDVSRREYNLLTVRINDVNISITKMLRAILVQLSLATVKKNDQIILDIGKPDYSILPQKYQK